MFVKVLLKNARAVVLKTSAFDTKLVSAQTHRQFFLKSGRNEKYVVGYSSEVMNITVHTLSYSK